MKKLKTAFVISFLLLLLIPVLTMNRNPHVTSAITNARLTEWQSENFDPRHIDAYVEDRIGLYDVSILAYTVLNDRFFGKMVHPNYTYGKDNMVFMNIVEEQVDEEFIDLFTRYLRLVQDTCAEQGIPFIYCINPSKNTVYQEYLPDGYNYENRSLQILYENLQKYGVNYISNVELLMEQAKTEDVYNKKFDAGHWNELGQFYGTNHLLDKVSEYFPEVKSWSFDDFEITHVREEFLPVSQFRVNEIVPKFNYKFKENVVQTTSDYDHVRVDERHPHFQTYERADNSDNLPSALFFHGSYYNKNADFYVGAFSEIYTVHNYQNLLQFDYYLDVFEPDILMLETAEYATTSSYFDMEEMKKQLAASDSSK